MEFTKQANWIFHKNDEGKILAEVTFPEIEKGVVSINRTFVDDSLRHQGIADRLMQECHDTLNATNRKAVLVCPYAVKWYENNPDKSDIVVER